MELAVVLLSVFMSIAAAMGAFITHLSWRTYVQQRLATYRWLAFGMGLLTLGVLTQGFVFNILRWSLAWSQVVAAATMVAAFGALLRSLYA